MAGFFGLFNYEKEGPGVEKNAPRKRKFFLFFEIYFKNFWKLAVNGIWYIFLTLIGVTSGLAAAGFTNIARNMAVDTHSFGTSDFFDTIKKNWKLALPAGIINAVVLAVLLGDIYFFYAFTDGPFSVAGIAVALTVLIVFLMMRYYIWTILITFKLKLSQIYKNSFKFALIGLKQNFVVLLVLLAVYAALFGLLWINVGITNLLFVLLVIFFLPGFRFFLIEFCVFDNIKKHMIVPYYTAHPDEDIELRRRLGVYEEEDDEEENETEE